MPTPTLPGFVIQKPTSITVTGTGSHSSTITTAGSFTITSSQTFTVNGVFDSAYDSYVFLFTGVCTSALNTYMRLSSSGTPDSGSNYVRRRVDFAAGTNTVTTSQSAPTTSGQFCVLTTGRNIVVQRLFRPADTTNTLWLSTHIDDDAGARGQQNNAVHTLSTAYDGFYVVANGSATISGEGVIYAYNS